MQLEMVAKPNPGDWQKDKMCVCVGGGSVRRARDVKDWWCGGGAVTLLWQHGAGVARRRRAPPATTKQGPAWFGRAVDLIGVTAAGQTGFACFSTLIGWGVLQRYRACAYGNAVDVSKGGF